MSIRSLLKMLSKPAQKKAVKRDSIDFPGDKTSLSNKIGDNVEWLANMLGNPPDLVTREITIGTHKVTVVYSEALVEKNIINNLLYGLMIDSNKSFIMQEDLFNAVKEKILNSGNIAEVTTLGKALEAITFGDSVVLFDGYTKALTLDTKSWAARAVEDSKIESTLRGPRDAFNENITTNLALIRMRLKDPKLRVYRTFVGERTNTALMILYVEDIAKPEIFDELLQRIDKVEVDGVLGSGKLEQLIEDNIFSPFPQALFSERPDKAVAHLLEGRYVILVDGTPFSLIVPVTMAQFLSSPEDYSDKWLTASAVRLLRYAAVLMSMFLPAIYIALTTFHYHLIPSQLILPIAESRAVVPFTPFTEAIIMELTLELLREAAIRLPSAVGQTIGVVGGIIVGNAAIQAGLFSPLLIIVVALTAISTFIIPNYNFGLAVRFVRFPIAIISSIFGGFGIIIAWIMLTTHLVTLESFGVPYAAPFAPLRFSDLKDTIIKVHPSYMLKRPESARAQDKQRQVPKREN